MDALFANMYLACGLLTEAMMAFLEGLTAIHRSPAPAADTTEHRLIVRHPDTGGRALFVNFGRVSHIVQLSPTESTAVLEMLYRIVEANQGITCQVRWAPNTLVFWDNRCAQRHALWDYDARHASAEPHGLRGGHPPGPRLPGALP
jgi:taurine dioxygenase